MEQADDMASMFELDGLEELEPVANGRASFETQGILRNSRYSPSGMTKRGAREELHQRDLQAIKYARGELNEGDTLVVIKYPNNVKVVDSAGFEVKTRHRVHSHKLLETGSSVFKKMLEPLLQGRFRRRLGYTNGKQLPPGVQYILDLTPPDEGDDATELVADLTCSPGVLTWYTSVKRLGVSPTLVGGKDEREVPKDAPPIPEPASPTKPSFENIKIEPIVVTGFSVSQDGNKSSTPSPKNTEFAQALAGSDTDAAFQQALKESKEEAERKKIQYIWPGNEDKDETSGTAPLDYDPIRHRVGIERLLQLIEGKDVLLDSAPKVWTLVMLAKFFKCTSSVTDYVTTWLFAEPNCAFIEILPEATIRIGYALESASITRRAFAILVSEEAIRAGTPHFFLPLLTDEEKAKVNGKNITRFGRPRENIINDDEITNTMQHAFRAFSARIEGIFTDLVGPKLTWLDELPEFKKLNRFLQFSKESTSMASKKPTAAVQIMISCLKSDLGHYVRGRLFSCLVQPLIEVQAQQASYHRFAESWNSRSDKDFGDLYDNLGDSERSMCRYFWNNLSRQEWSTDCLINLVANYSDEKHPFPGRQDILALDFDIKKIYIPRLEEQQNEFNRAVINAVLHHNYNNGNLPGYSLKPRSGPVGESPALHEIIQNLKSDVFSTWKMRNSLMEITDPNPSASDDGQILSDSPFFHLPRFLQEVSKHVRHIATPLLWKGECDFTELVDSLTCLTDNEWKFLPLWAGGMDDGTGGVFNDMIPSAERGGPVGPGPSYHTGSTLNSWAGSDIGPNDSFSVIDTITEGIDSSVQVDDGYSSHIDRRIVVSEDDFPVNDNEDTVMFDDDEEDLDLYNE